MPIIGKPLQTGGYHVLDALSASSTNSYTLQLGGVNFAPESANHLLVSLNSLIQKPGSSFSVSGSTLTFIPSSGTLSSSDSIDFVIALGNTLDIGTPSDGVITNAKLASDLISGETDIGGAIADADLFLLDDGAGGTLRKTAASRIKTYVGGTTPAFYAVLSADTNISHDTWTKLAADTEHYDSGSVYDNSTNYRWTPGVSGRYFCYGHLGLRSGTSSTVQSGGINIYKNGSASHVNSAHDMYDNKGTMIGVSVGGIIELDDDDYIELYGKLNVSSGTPRFEADFHSTDGTCGFGAFKIG